MLSNNYDVLTFLRLAFTEAKLLYFSFELVQPENSLVTSIYVSLIVSKGLWDGSIKMAVKVRTERFAHLALFYDGKSSGIVIKCLLLFQLSQMLVNVQ